MVRAFNAALVTLYAGAVASILFGAPPPLDTFTMTPGCARSNNVAKASDNILAHIAPIGFRHSNFDGVYWFPLAVGTAPPE